MTAVFALYLASRPVYVLHVIGLVGVDKTRFFREYFPTLPVFDIQAVYHDHLFSPADLKSDSVIYRQFAQALETEWGRFLHAHDPQNHLPGSFCVGVESSGINQTLNVLFVPFFPTVLWIQGDPPPASDEAFWASRPYGLMLNAVLTAKWAAGEINSTHLYNVTQLTFSADLPSEFAQFCSQKFNARIKPSRLLEMDSVPRRLKCLICQAPFSSQPLFTKHMQCHESL